MANGWGGRRANQTGRPKGSVKAEGVRKQRQIRAYDDEWDIIQKLARLVKHGDRAACEAFLAKMETKTE